MESPCARSFYSASQGQGHPNRSAKPLRPWAALLAAVLPIASGCVAHEEHAEHGEHKIVATTPKVKDVVLTQQYVCQIHSQRHIKVKALQSGYLEPIQVKEGQAVHKDQVLFTVVPILYKARLDSELAEAKLAQLELNNAKKLYEQKVVSVQEVMLYEAKLAKAAARADLARAELNFATVRAAFDGILDRLHEQQGSLVKEGDVLTTLSDNSVMWVYFNVPEKQYFEYKAEEGTSDPQNPQRLRIGDARIELVLADGSKFQYDAGSTVTVEGKFNNETGNGTFRADFPNPDRLLRHGMTGNVLIQRTLKNALVVPQRATFEILDRRYVFVIDKEGVVRQREIHVQNELQDAFVIKKGLDAEDKIVFEGIRQVRDGDKVEFEFRAPDQILAKQEFHAE